MTSLDPNAEKPFDSDAYAPPTAPTHPALPPSAPEHATSGQRIAGALLIANAVMIGFELFVAPTDPTSKNPLDSPVRTAIPALIDVLIGIALLAKYKKIVPWAVFRASLGMVVFVAMRAAQGDAFSTLMQVAVSSSLLLLLTGDASKARIVAGVALFGIYSVFGFLGVGAHVIGKNPLALLIQNASGQLEPKPAGVVTGEQSHYRLTAPSDKWRLRKRELAKKDNPLADRWLTRPEFDAHVIVIAEKVAGAMVLPDALTDVVIDSAKRGSTELTIVARTRLRTRPEEGRMLHTRSTVNGLAIESLVGVIGYYEHGFQIVAFAPRTSFASVESEMRSIVESFEPPTDEPPGPTDDCEPNPVTRIDGIAQKYVLTSPGEGWFLRTDQATKKDNTLADRWIVRPDKGGHILVIAEQIPGAVIDLEKYTDAIADNIKKGLGGEVIARTESKSHPKIGRILHARATVQGAPFEYLYGLFAEGPRAFQVISFSHAESFGKLEADFRKTIEEFKMPDASP